MTELISTSTPLPLPQVNVTIRPGVMSDIPFLDALQKLHTKQVGWMPTKQFEGKINAGHVLVAEELRVEDGESRVAERQYDASSALNSPLSTINSPLGYLIGNDQYFKRDDVGIIYQMNVVPGKQRGFIGATLLQAQFERSAYGCKLYCCWCAQDIAANKFWEAMGFVPLAFRTGSEKKARTHIFWQKRIRSGDVTTPWWFPSKTAGGSIREDRIVLPIPPGTHWSDAKPMILPGAPANVDRGLSIVEKKQPNRTAKRQSTVDTQHSKTPTMLSGGLRFAPITPVAPVKEKAKREPKPKQKNDPRLVAAARELRDRWLEQVNAEPTVGCGKYEVSRAIAGPGIIESIPLKRLNAA